jgi:ATP-dependent Clp protease ATP-binding subunit ClpC
VFERFSAPARRAVVLAQEEARRLRHTWIGTEHLLLGLAGDEHTLAGRALGSLGVTLDAARQEVFAIVGAAEEPAEPVSTVPFTPRAKKALELALREAQRLGDHYIGSAHLLLGLVREGDGVAVEVLRRLGAAPATVTDTTVALLQAPGGDAEAVEPLAPGEHRVRGEPGPAGARCPACKGDLAVTATTVTVGAGDRDVVLVVCGACGTAIGALPA